MNISTDLEIIDNVIQNDNFDFHIIDHPMKPFGIRYWNSFDFAHSLEEYLEYRSPQACSWLRDQEYLVDFRYYESLEFKDGGLTSYFQILPKVRYFFNKISTLYSVSLF